jgi:hypothetical protein
MPRGPTAPLFVTRPRGRPPATPRPSGQPELPDVADCRTLSLAPGYRVRTRCAGLFLFLPLLTRLGFDGLVRQAGYPGSRMVPPASALLSLLTLKLLDKERRSHIDDFNFDAALGLFAGLNVLPKKSYATAYSYRTVRDHQRALLVGWVRGLSGLLFPQPEAFSLDFHAIPYRGDDAGLERHYLPRRGKAGTSVLTFFALENESRVLCYANANLTRADQPGEPMRFVEFWHELTGADPPWLYLDSKVMTYPELSLLNGRGIWFVTIRRRGVAIRRRLGQLPATVWQRAVIDTPKRCHQHIRYVDERVHLAGYVGEARQLAVTGLGREEPTLFLSNNLTETARGLLIRYAGRNRVEDGLGHAVNFFHLDCLASEVRLNVDLDAALTVLANGCYRWLGKQLKGFEKAAPKQLCRRFVETAGLVEAEEGRLVVRFDRRSHNPVLREAALDRDQRPIPWLGNRSVTFVYP